MAERAPWSPLAWILAGCASLVLSTLVYALLLPAWSLIAVGLALLARSASWRRAARAGLVLHVGITLLFLVAAGVTLGVAGKAAGGFGPLADDWILITLGLLGAPLGVSVALSFDPTPAHARRAARASVLVGAVGLIGAALSVFNDSLAPLLGVPMVALVMLSPLAPAVALWGTLRHRGGGPLPLTAIPASRTR